MATNANTDSPLLSAILANAPHCVAIRSPDASRLCSAWAPPLALDLSVLRTLQTFNASAILPAATSSISSFESPADALDQALIALARESYLASRLARPRASCRSFFDLRYANSFWCAHILSLSHDRCNGTKLGFAPPPPVCLPTCMAFADSVRSSQCAGPAVTALARCSFSFPGASEPCVDGIRVEASTCGYTRPNAIGCKCPGVDPSKYPCVPDPDEPAAPPSNVLPPSETSSTALTDLEPHNATTIAVATVSAVVLVTGLLLGILLYRRRQQRHKLRAFSVPVREADLVNPALLAAAGPSGRSSSPGSSPSSAYFASSLTGDASGRGDSAARCSESPKPVHPTGSPRMTSRSPPTNAALVDPMATAAVHPAPPHRPTSAHLMDGDDLADIVPPSLDSLAPLVPSHPSDPLGDNPLPSRQSSLSRDMGYASAAAAARRKSPVAARTYPDPTTMSLYAPSEVSSVFANPIPMKVVALFTATRSDEIAGVQVGDVVSVYKTYVDNWCLVLTDKDEEGYMPLACLETTVPLPSPSIEYPLSPLSSQALAGTLVIETGAAQSPTLSPIPSSGLVSGTDTAQPPASPVTPCSTKSPSPTSRLILDLGGTRRESLYLSHDDVGDSWSALERLASGGKSPTSDDEAHDKVPPIPTNPGATSPSSSGSQ